MLTYSYSIGGCNYLKSKLHCDHRYLTQTNFANSSSIAFRYSKKSCKCQTIASYQMQIDNNSTKSFCKINKSIAQLTCDNTS